MTQEELLKAFQAAVDSNGTLVPDKFVELQRAVTKDYEDIETVRTTNKTLTDQITQLETDNKDLKETNLKLFMLGFKDGTLTGGQQGTATTEPEINDPSTEPEQVMTPDEIVNTMFNLKGDE